MRKIAAKDREMGLKPRENSGTLRKMTKQGSRGDFGWKQPIFGYLKWNGTDLQNIAKVLQKLRLLTQLNSSYKGGSVLEALAAKFHFDE